MTANDHLIEFRNVSRRFFRTQALNDASFTVPPGSITAMLGANGAGKSTALRLAVNLLKPNSGSARVLGVDSRRLAPEHLQRIAYVAEGMDLPMWMTVEQFLNWCRPLYPKWDRDLERRLARGFKLPMDRRLRNLSRGQRMKAALLSTLAYRPQLILMDEPFSGLDPLVRDELVDSLLEMANNQGWGVIMSSHDIAEVSQLADRVVMMRFGRVIEETETEALLARHRRVEVLLPDSTEKMPDLPASWVGAERKGRVLRFVDTKYDEIESPEKLKRFVPSATQPELHPLTLREVFAVLATAGHLDIGA